jgi:putative hemolysin
VSALTFVLATSGFHAEDAILIFVIALLLAGSGVLAMAETSLVRMNRIKAKSLVDEKKRGARQLARLVENPAKFLNPILLVVLICQLVSATLVGIVAEHLFGALGVLLGIVFEIVVIFVFFEAVPKNWAVQHPSRAALLSAPIVSTLIRFPPIRWLSLVLIGLANRIIGVAGEDQEGIHQTYITDSELKAMADVAHEENVIERDERTFIHSIIDFGDTVAREVMTPRPDMITVEGDVTVRDALEAALAAGYSRIPVEGDGIDDIIGIAYTKDLVRAERVGKAAQMVRESMRPAKFIPESKEVSDLLREMQEEKFHMAVVVDEYGGTAGLITLEDLLEELVGDIVDEFDVEEPTVERFADGSVLVSALFSVDDADDLLGADLPHGPWDTVGGLMLDLVGRVPDKGDSVEVDGFRLTAVDVRGRRIERVRIEPTDSAQDLDGDGDVSANGH